MSSEFIQISQAELEKVQQSLAGKSFDDAQNLVESKFKELYPEFDLKPIEVVTEFDKKANKNISEPRLLSLSKMIKNYQETQKGVDKKTLTAQAREIVNRAKRYHLGDFLFVVTKAMGYMTVFKGVASKGQQITLGMQSAKLANSKAYVKYTDEANKTEAVNRALAEAAVNPAARNALRMLAEKNALPGITVRDIDAIVVSRQDEPVVEEKK
jgi:hypothetical protein